MACPLCACCQYSVPLRTPLVQCGVWAVDMIQVRKPYVFAFELQGGEPGLPPVTSPPRTYLHASVWAFDEDAALSCVNHHLQARGFSSALLIGFRCTERHGCLTLLPVEIDLIAAARRANSRIALLVRLSLHL